eukprot:514640_1
MSRSQYQWTTDEEIKLILLNKSGIALHEIASRMKRTTNDILFKYANPDEKSKLVNLEQVIDHFGAQQSLKSIRKILLNQIDKSLLIGVLIDSGVITQIIKLLQINIHKNDLLCSGYIRQSKLDNIFIRIPIDIINVINKICMIYSIESIDNLQNEGIGILISIAADTSENARKYKQYLVNHNIILLLTESFVLSFSLENKSNTIKALGNIVSGSIQNRDLLLQYDILQHIQRLLVNTDSNTITNDVYGSLLLQNISWTLSHLCGGIPFGKWEYIELIIQLLLIILNKYKDNDTLSYICWAFNCLTYECSEQQMEYIIQYALIPLSKLLNNKSEHVAYVALKTIGNISSFENENINVIQKIIDIGILKYLKKLITEKEIFKREVCWTLSNITASISNHIHSVIKHGLIEDVIHILNTTCDQTYFSFPDEQGNEGMFLPNSSVGKEALWTICNITVNGLDKHIRYLIQCDVIPALCNFVNNLHLFLDEDELNGDPMMALLEGIENILQYQSKCFKLMNGKQFRLLTALEKNEIISGKFSRRVKWILDKYKIENGKTTKVPKRPQVPKNYICVKCKMVGTHWIMECQ